MPLIRPDEEISVHNRTRTPWLLLVAVSLWPAPAASAVTFDWVTVGDPGNACDPQGTAAASAP